MRVSSNSTMAVIGFRRHGSKPTMRYYSSSSTPIPRETQENARVIRPYKRIANSLVIDRHQQDFARLSPYKACFAAGRRSEAVYRTIELARDSVSNNASTSAGTVTRRITFGQRSTGGAAISSFDSVTT
jgi:hypothetical protein